MVTEIMPRKHGIYFGLIYQSKEKKVISDFRPFTPEWFHNGGETLWTNEQITEAGMYKRPSSDL
jgi:hypothetical protein